MGHLFLFARTKKVSGKRYNNMPRTFSESDSILRQLKDGTLAGQGFSVMMILSNHPKLIESGLSDTSRKPARKWRVPFLKDGETISS